jgi:hypothetical protein
MGVQCIAMKPCKMEGLSTTVISIGMLDVPELEKIIQDLQKRVERLEGVVYKKSSVERQDVTSLVVGNVDKIGTQDLVILALRIKPDQNKAEIKAILGDWGKSYGSWFKGGNFSGRLVKKGFVKKAGQNKEGNELFQLTKKGELHADELLSKIK